MGKQPWRGQEVSGQSSVAVPSTRHNKPVRPLVCPSVVRCRRRNNHACSVQTHHATSTNSSLRAPDGFVDDDRLLQPTTAAATHSHSGGAAPPVSAQCSQSHSTTPARELVPAPAALGTVLLVPPFVTTSSPSALPDLPVLPLLSRPHLAHGTITHTNTHPLTPPCTSISALFFSCEGSWCLWRGVVGLSGCALPLHISLRASPPLAAIAT